MKSKLESILFLVGLLSDTFCANFEHHSTNFSRPDSNQYSRNFPRNTHVNVNINSNFQNKQIKFLDNISQQQHNPNPIKEDTSHHNVGFEDFHRNHAINFTMHLKTEVDINFDSSDSTGFDTIGLYGPITNSPTTTFIEDHGTNQYESDDYETEILHQQLLDRTLTRLMHMKRPSVVDGAFQLFSKPYFSFLPDLGPLKQLLQWGSQSANSYATCYACKVGFGLFLTKARRRTTLEDILQQATFGCSFFGIAAPEVCDGLINRFAPILHYIGTSRRDITAGTFCGMALQSSGCTNKNLKNEWNIDLEDYQIQKYGPKLKSSNQILFDNDDDSLGNNGFPINMKTLKVLHLTDIHLDLEYSPGSDTDCPNELCCRNNGEFPEAGNRAGYYGDYSKCDLPYHSFQDALQHISKTHPDIGLIYMTGDLVPHNIWNTSSQKNINTIQIASTLIREYFPHTKVLPVLGNHEPHPVNLYSPVGVPHQFSTDWIYGVTANAWGDWIPKESIHNFLHAGFYDVQISEKFRVVILNTNLCYTYNFWQIYDHRDPGGQLRWLVRLLQKSEKLGEKVHILGHVPPSQDECWSVWGRNFYQIINRFKSTVKAQFYGHTHFDEFQLYYDEEQKNIAINPIWIGASLTPYTNLNPGYKIFTVDGSRGIYSTWNVIDHETWIYNLTEANLNPFVSPRWFKLYQATKAFGIPNVLPKSLNEFVHRMSSNSTTFDEYYRYYHKVGDPSLEKPCDVFCRKRILCAIVTPYFSEQTECLNIKSEVDGVVLPQIIFEQRTTSTTTTTTTSKPIIFKNVGTFRFER